MSSPTASMQSLDAGLDVAVAVAGRRLRGAARRRRLVRLPLLAAVAAAPRRDADRERARDLRLAAAPRDVDVLHRRRDDEARAPCRAPLTSAAAARPRRRVAGGRRPSSSRPCRAARRRRAAASSTDRARCRRARTPPACPSLPCCRSPRCSCSAASCCARPRRAPRARSIGRRSRAAFSSASSASSRASSSVCASTIFRAPSAATRRSVASSSCDERVRRARSPRARRATSRARARRRAAPCRPRSGAELAHVRLSTESACARAGAQRASGDDSAHVATTHQTSHALHRSSAQHATVLRLWRVYTRSRMALLDSLRVLGAMARVTAPSLVEHRPRPTERASAIDERAHWFGRRVIELLDVHLVATGAERVPTGRAYVYMSNHQSHLDIPMLYATLPSPTIRMLAQEGAVPDPAVGARPARGRVHRGRPRRPHARDEVDRVRGASSCGSGVEHLPRAGGHPLARRHGRHAEEGRLPPRARDRRADRAGRDHRARSTSCRAARKVMHTGREVRVTIGAPIPVESRDRRAHAEVGLPGRQVDTRIF